MSEYQYYEFAAIDRSLTRTEMTELCAVSTRAEITPVSFVNHYEWGDLKANPADWMRRYFDAFVYLADWCSCWLALRVPLATFREAELESYASENALTIDASNEHWIFNWALDESDNYDRFAEDDGSSWMKRLAPLRNELLRGDLRPLYLGWIADAASLPDDELEPEVPPGLADLTSAQEALVEFLEVDPDLLTAASFASAPASSQGTVEDKHIHTWLETWSNDDMKAVLKHIAMGLGQEAERQVKARYAAWLKTQRSLASSTAPRRSIAELNELAQSAASDRRQREAKESAKQQEKRRQQHEALLRHMMAKANTYWLAANTQAERGGASGYDSAMRILTDLAEGYVLTASREAFESELQRFLIPHSRRGALLRRLAKAGLWRE